MANRGSDVNIDFSDACRIWGYGQLFTWSGLEGQTDFRGGLVAQSIEDGLLFRQPGLARLQTSPILNAKFGSDWAELETDNGRVRLAFINAHQVVIEGTVQLEELDDEYSHLELVERERYSVLTVRGIPVPIDIDDLDTLQNTRRAWVKSHFSKFPSEHQALGKKALNQMKSMIYAPEGQYRWHVATPDKYPHREVWLWDSVFHAIGYRHLDGALARGMISAVLAAQLPSGQIPISFSPYSTRSHRTQPPILAWGVYQLMQTCPDAEWLSALIDPLRKYLKWFEDHRMLDGLFGWVEDNGALGSVCDESGMDNSPRFSGGKSLQAIDLCCYMAQEYQAMAKLDPKGDWSKKAAVLKQKVLNEFWDDGLGFFCDRDPEVGKTTGIQAVTGFLPLILGDLPKFQLDALRCAALDRTRFGTDFPLPSVAATDPRYAKDMWQGPVWINMNWMIARGFARCGETELALRLRQKTLDAMEADYLATGSIFEYYDDSGAVPPPQLLRKGKTDTVIDPKHPSIHMVIHDYGWSATLALDWILRGDV